MAMAKLIDYLIGFSMPLDIYLEVDTVPSTLCGLAAWQMTISQSHFTPCR
jgi:hypothetical protein